ncbi:MAG: UDP-2,3-diacylglucosamine diphosphatase [Bacteroidia bacterium]|nr:UDP-2,3-diacylglucosamine diphosphatase [Bacteroidia bacterium]
MHAGAPSRQASETRERHFIQWLERHAPEAAAFYLLGDIWDFWFEYRHAVPKGHTRLLAALAEVVEAAIPIYFQVGNHDCWLTDYLTQEIGLKRLSDPFRATWQGMLYFLSHGHRIGPIPWTDKLAYTLMESRLLQKLYRWLHPDIGLYIGRFLSGRSRQAHLPMDDIDLGEKEYLRLFVKAEQRKAPADWYIFGHRHLALVERIGSSYIVLLGDWIRRYTFLKLQEGSWGLYTYSLHHEILPLIEGSILHLRKEA